MAATPSDQKANGASPPTHPHAPGAAKFVHALARAAEGCHLYWPDHPGVRTVTDEAQAALATLLREESSLALYVTETGWVYHDVPLGDVGTPGTEVAACLHQRGFVALQIVRPLKPPELLALAEVLGALKRTNAPLDGEKTLRERTGGGAQLVGLRTQSLRLVQGTRDARDTPASGARDWRTILNDLFSGTPTTGEADTAAAEIAAHVAISDAHTVGTLRGELWRRAAAAHGEKKTDAVWSRLRRFVRNLSPAVRQALLATPDMEASLSLPFLSSVASELSAEQIVSAVRQLQTDGPVSRDTVLMFEGLARSAEARGAGIGEFVHTLEEWRRAGQPGEATNEIDRALHELMTMRRDSDFTPEDYRKQLEHAALVLGHAPAVCRLLPVAPERTHSQSVAAAAIVCRDCEWENPGPVLERVERGLETLIRDQRFDLLGAVRSAAVRATRVPKRAEVGERIERRLRDSDLIGAALARAVSSEADPDARDFVVGAGAAGISLLLRASADAPEDQRRSLLRAALAEIDDAALHGLIAVAATQGPASLPALLEDLCTARGPGAHETLRRALRGASPAVAAHLMASLPDAHDALAAALCEEALAHPAPGVGHEALNRSARATTIDPHIQILSRYLNGGLLSANHDDALVRHAIRTLLAFPGAGTEAATRVLKLLLRSWKCRYLRIGARLAPALRAAAPEDADARLACRRWRYSIQGWVGAALVATKRQGRDADAH